MPDIYELTARQVLFGLSTTGVVQRLDVTSFPGDVVLLKRHIAEKGYDTKLESNGNVKYLLVAEYPVGHRIYPLIS